MSESALATIVVRTKVGTLSITGNREGKIAAIRFGKGTIHTNIPLALRERAATIVRAIDNGAPLDIPRLTRGTEFQEAVWRAIALIPRGQTATYQDIARNIGRPTATRAVAGACAKNPLLIIVPCHRVVGTRGLGGYSGSIRRKIALLRYEQSRSPIR